ncbi:MAG: hypothetical protein J7L34_06915 [Thermotogaceae bacterium]|nr:hypothetical protein [Thermotogaceae bacterium]
MYNLHLLLGHVVADHSFTNNAKIRKYSGWNLAGHMIWSFLAILAFTFDILLKSKIGIFVLGTFTAIHIMGDYLRTVLYKQNKKRMIDLLEFGLLVIAFTFNSLVQKEFNRSYLSGEFIYYLLGMSIVTTFVTYFFRNFYPKIEDLPDVDGITERMIIFIFFLAKKPLFVFFTILVAFAYRVIKYRKPDNLWWMSPLFGLGISLFWYLTIYVW